jgi:predicted nucleotidyltransferase
MSRRRPTHISRDRHRDERRRERGLIDVTVWVPSHKAEAVKRHAARLERRTPLDRDFVISKIRERKEDILGFGVKSISLFGSVARDEARYDSDVDLLVEFEPGRPSGLFEFIDLKHLLEGWLGRPVDLVTPETLKQRLKDRILEGAERVF